MAHPKEDRHPAAVLGLSLMEAERFGEAEDHLREALLERPEDLAIRMSLVECLMRKGDVDQVLHHLHRIIRQDPGHMAALRRLLDVYTAVRDRAGVIRVLDHWLTVDPENIEMRWERGMTHLMEGHLLQGWEDIEARFQLTDQVISMMGPFEQPVWDGRPFPGKTLLLHWEQGLGDTLMFIRYAKQVKALGGRVVAVVQPTLVDLVATCEGLDEVIADEAPLPAFDLHLPMMSLPRAFRTEEATIPGEVPYLRVPERIPNLAALRPILSAPTDQLRVGYVWTGSSRHLNNALRSMPPEELARLGALPEVAWHSFQVPSPSELPLPSVCLGPLLKSFSDTAYALSCMDLVITVDTAVAHLAGALGLPTFLMLPFGSEWRWQWDRPDSPWYPTLRLYRQAAPGDWHSVIDQILGDLRGDQNHA